MTVLHGPVAKSELGTADGRIQGVRLQLESHLWLGRIFSKKTLADHMCRSHLIEVKPGDGQGAPINGFQAVAARIAAHKRAHVIVEKALNKALGLKELAKIAERHITGAVRVKGISLVDRLAIEAIQLTLITLIHEPVSVVEHQAPTVFGKRVEPGRRRPRQTTGRRSQNAQRVALVSHACLGHFVRGQVRGAGTSQTRQLQL
ncbi:hypothetical protein D3C87_1293490 [compost metagenome]